MWWWGTKGTLEGNELTGPGPNIKQRRKEVCYYRTCSLRFYSRFHNISLKVWLWWAPTEETSCGQCQTHIVMQLLPSSYLHYDAGHKFLKDRTCNVTSGCIVFSFWKKSSACRRDSDSWYRQRTLIHVWQGKKSPWINDHIVTPCFLNELYTTNWIEMEARSLLYKTLYLLWKWHPFLCVSVASCLQLSPEHSDWLLGYLLNWYLI